jgi:hypothetical protein
MLLLELIATRLFSALFFYHYTFFAISLVMSGLTFGGLLAARWHVAALTEADFRGRLAGLASVFALGTLAALLVIVAHPPVDYGAPGLGTVLLLALAFLPGLTAAGAFLAAAFARDPGWIGRLYAADLVAAAVACAGAIVLLRVVQGPAALLLTVLLAALAALALGPARGWLRSGALTLTALAALGIAANVASDGRLLRLRASPEPTWERWNEHSRVRLYGTTDRPGLVLTIDTTASMSMPRTPRRAEGGPLPLDPGWAAGSNYLGYRLGRPLARTAVIGVGGGRDVLAALAHGARHVDGYELNGIVVDLLRRDRADFTGLASWPEVSLIHDEARVGITHAGTTYDLIQASLIDTFGAVAQGGLVLSENGLYTVEGWRTFLAALREHGVLTMTRFYVPEAPAEMQRLVSLAIEALRQEGIADPRGHIALVSNASDAEARKLRAVWGTIVVAKTPFSADELARIARISEAEGWELLITPSATPADPVVAQLLDPARRDAAIASSPYDLSPPTDVRPFFFLQMRLRDVLDPAGASFGYLYEVTFRAVRVIILLGGLALLFAALVLLLASISLPSAAATSGQRRRYRWMSGYFLGIGFGYILVQLGLHQRLTLILGHPTLALAVVLASMLLGTGMGSLASHRLFAGRRLPVAWFVILVTLAGLVLGLPALARLEQVDSSLARALAAGAVTGTVGFVLGFGFPLGVRLVAPAGEWAVQKMWAVNGAASIAGSALAVMLGLGLGSHAVLAAGFLCYVLVACCGLAATRTRVDAAAEHLPVAPGAATPAPAAAT